MEALPRTLIEEPEQRRRIDDLGAFSRVPPAREGALSTFAVTLPTHTSAILHL